MDSTLVELKRQAPFDADQWALLRHHIQLNGAATIVLGVLVIAWLGASDRIRERRISHICWCCSSRSD